MDHLSTLNDRQKDAVLHTEGPLLVLAGAGSGKTRVITHRILHLIEKGVAPEQILAVTFTNKAAKEMRERVKALLEKESGARRSSLDRLPVISTFHSLGVLLIREHHEVFGLKRHFAIYDRADSVRAIKQGLELAGYSPKQFEPRKILGMISKAKGEALTQSSFLESARSYPERVAGAVWEHYEKILREEQALDFDDLLLKTQRMLVEHPEILKLYQDRFLHIHIDEYQDTNKVQYEIARLLSAQHTNICVVGDIDQNIYSWRGADINNILQFERHFPSAKVILLEENYRSTKTIIAASNSIIEKNHKRIPKVVFTNNHDGEPISLYTAYNETDEAHHIAETARELIRDGASPSSIAVLYRANFLSRALEDAFLARSVPYQMLGTRFFERKEIKDVLSFLRLSLNPESMGDLARVINVPPRGIGKVTLLKILEGKKDELRGATKEKVAAFYQLLAEISDSAKTRKLSETLKLIVKRSGLEEMFKKGGEEELERLENIRELVSLALRYEEYEPLVAAERLLEDAALQSDQDELKKEEDAVRLMTVHAAKGLEFPYVFICGLEEGLFPHERLSDEQIDEEEERRLFYVALTRAGKKVFLSFSHTRTIYGSQRINIPSSFLSDLGEEYMESMNPRESGYEKIVEID